MFYVWHTYCFQNTELNKRPLQMKGFVQQQFSVPDIRLLHLNCKFTQLCDGGLGFCNRFPAFLQLRVRSCQKGHNKIAKPEEGTEIFSFLGFVVAVVNFAFSTCFLYSLLYFSAQKQLLPPNRHFFNTCHSHLVCMPSEAGAPTT